MSPISVAFELTVFSLGENYELFDLVVSDQ